MTIRAMMTTNLFLLVQGLSLSAWAAAPTDTTKSDSANSINDIQTVNQLAPVSTQEPMTDWGLRDRILKLTAPTQFTGEVRGRLTAVAGDTLVIEQFSNRESNYIRVPVSQVTRCQVHDGRRGHFIVGTLTGAALGCGVSLLLLANDDDSHDFIDLSGAIVVMGTGAGVVVGGLIGIFARTDKWKEVPVGSVQLGISPTSGARPGFSVSLKF